MHFSINPNGLVIAYGKEQHPNSVFVEESDLPNWWYETFIQCRLGYTEERGLYFITEDEVALMSS